MKDTYTNAAPVNGGEREKPAPLTLTGWQLLEALDLIAPDRATDTDQLDGEIALQMGDESGHSGSGLYAWDAEYPEEGSSFLTGERVSRETVIEWLDALGIEVTDKQLDGLFHARTAIEKAKGVHHD
jgi:hypothetical protein